MEEVFLLVGRVVVVVGCVVVVVVVVVVGTFNVVDGGGLVPASVLM